MTAAGCASIRVGDRACVRGTDDVAGIDQPHADAPVARRRDGGVVELGLRRLDRRVIGIERGGQLIDLALLQIDVLLGLEALERQRLEAREILLRRTEQRLVLGLFRLGLIERSLEQARVDPGEHVALLDVLPLGERHLLQFSVDLGVDAHARYRLHRAETGEVDRHVLPGRDRHADRNRGTAGSTRGTPGIGSFGAATVPVNGTAAGHDDGDDQDGDPADPTPLAANHRAPSLGGLYHQEISYVR